MNTLIIYAHPKTEGHCSTILKEVIEYLSTNKFEAALIDLYKINYDPVLHENELYTSGNKEVNKQNLEFQKRVKDADNLIFIYPVWWGSMPAILKGFFDKVFTNGFAFEFINNMPNKLLTGKKAVVFTTSGGPTFASKLLMGNRAANLIEKDILGFSGIKAKVFQIGNAMELDGKQREEIKGTVRKGLITLFKTE
jgi:NAD(P)H dehydrogenase (quinone)